MKDARESPIIKELDRRRQSRWRNMLRRITRHEARSFLKEPSAVKSWAFPSIFIWFPFSAGIIYLFSGEEIILKTFRYTQVWNSSDPISGLSWRYILLALGLAELFAAWLLLLTNKYIFSIAFSAWLTLAFMTYRIGLWFMGFRHPWIFVDDFVRAGNLSPTLADQFLGIFTGSLFIGSLYCYFRFPRLGLASKKTAIKPVTQIYPVE